MTGEEKREKLIKHLKYNRSIGADYMITDEDADEIIKALEQEPCDKYITEIDHLRKYISKLETQIVEQEPCDDVVNRKGLLKIYEDRFLELQKIKHLKDNKGAEDRQMGVNYCINILKEMPPVTSQPKIGHWISHKEHCENLGVMPSGLGAYKWCSNCDCGIDIKEWHRNHYNYCPNCGTKMEVEK